MARFRRASKRLAKSDEIRSAFALAAAEAHRLNDPNVGTEHVLMGIARLPGSRGAAMLTRLDVDREALVRDAERLAIAARADAGPESGDDQVRSDPTRPVLTPATMRAVEAAASEVESVGGTEIGSDVMIVGLLVEGRGIAARVLADAGVTLERARTLLDAGATGAPRAVTSPTTRRERVPRGSTSRARVRTELSLDVRPTRSAFTVEIDDRSPLSIYEQIIGRVQEAIAIGRMKPGDRLPPVRQLADNLDIAPGTVARAYTELEARRVVVTDGARGTRVAEQDRSSLSSEARRATLIEQLRPVAVEAFHLGASITDLHAALDAAAQGILPARGAD